jgi:hypothetical protein
MVSAPLLYRWCEAAVLFFFILTGLALFIPLLRGFARLVCAPCALCCISCAPRPALRQSHAAPMRAPVRGSGDTRWGWRGAWALRPLEVAARCVRA